MSFQIVSLSFSFFGVLKSMVTFSYAMANDFDESLPGQIQYLKRSTYIFDICLDMGIGGLLLTTIIVGAFHVPRCAWNIGSFTFLKDPDKDTTFDRNSIATRNTLNNNSDHNHEAPKCDPRTIKELEILQLQLLVPPCIIKIPLVILKKLIFSESYDQQLSDCLKKINFLKFFGFSDEIWFSWFMLIRKYL